MNIEKIFNERNIILSIDLIENLVLLEKTNGQKRSFANFLCENVHKTQFLWKRPFFFGRYLCAVKKFQSLTVG